MRTLVFVCAPTCVRVRVRVCVCVWPTGDNINDEARGQAKHAGIPRGDNIHTSSAWNPKRTLQRRRWASKRLFTHTHTCLCRKCACDILVAQPPCVTPPARASTGASEEREHACAVRRKEKNSNSFFLQGREQEGDKRNNNTDNNIKLYFCPFTGENEGREAEPA